MGRSLWLLKAVGAPSAAPVTPPAAAPAASPASAPAPLPTGGGLPPKPKEQEKKKISWGEDVRPGRRSSPMGKRGSSPQGSRVAFDAKTGQYICTTDNSDLPSQPAQPLPRSVRPSSKKPAPKYDPYTGALLAPSSSADKERREREQREREQLSNSVAPKVDEPYVDPYEKFRKRKLPR